LNKVTIYFKVTHDPSKDIVTIGLYRKEYTSSPWPSMDLMGEKSIKVGYLDDFHSMRRKINQARVELNDKYVKSVTWNKNMESLCSDLCGEFSTLE
jgi:hypothetical protein